VKDPTQRICIQKLHAVLHPFRDPMSNHSSLAPVEKRHCSCNVIAATRLKGLPDERLRRAAGHSLCASTAVVRVTAVQPGRRPSDVQTLRTNRERIYTNS